MDRFEEAARRFLLSSPFADDDAEAMVPSLAAEFQRWFAAGQEPSPSDLVMLAHEWCFANTDDADSRYDDRVGSLSALLASVRNRTLAADK